LEIDNTCKLEQSLMSRLGKAESDIYEKAAVLRVLKKESLELGTLLCILPFTICESERRPPSKCKMQNAATAASCLSLAIYILSSIVQINSVYTVRKDSRDKT
jgi:hypothetical protein